MFKNYFKTAWRNITRHKAYSALNIAGLSIGMACSILILLWVQNELSYDSFYANSGRLYQTWNKDNIAPIFANPNEGVPKKERKAAKLQN